MTYKPIEIPSIPEKPTVVPNEPQTPTPSREPEIQPGKEPFLSAPPKEIPPPSEKTRWVAGVSIIVKNYHHLQATLLPGLQAIPDTKNT